MIAFGLALLAKPTAVSLPIVLLVVDWWPLGRYIGATKKRLLILLAEKMPLMLLAAAAAGVTFYAQSSFGNTTLLAPSSFRRGWRMQPFRPWPI